MTTDQTQQSAPGLTVQDLIEIAKIIQVASSRSAFKVEEYTAVGATYDKLFTFLEASGAITATPPQANQADTPAESAE